jgi:lipopolysaccharide/colanic/teichoic acid biosynthesis glycosyltransferase
VGPRPERPPFIDVLSNEVPGYVDRLRFKPGITGLSQVELGYDTDVESVRNKVETDVRYITEFGLRLDLRIMLRTVRVVLTGEGAY